jgi:hypothetical protein
MIKYIKNLMFKIGYRVGQVRVVFSLPKRTKNLLPDNVQWPEHLAYVEWFTKFSAAPEAHHKMYKISRSFIHGDRLVSIVPVTNISRSVHLFPKFGSKVPREWTSCNVLDICPTFFVNSFSDKPMYASSI